MRTILMVHGGKVTNEDPSNRFVLRLEWAIDYYQENHSIEDITFLITGRYSSAVADYPFTEAEVGKRYVIDKFPEAKVVKEDVSLETIGNYAFSKPLLVNLKPDKVVILISDIMEARVQYIAHKLFGSAFSYSFQFIKDELSGDQALIDREEDALQLAKSILSQIGDEDDAKAREVLLYETPYYFKGIVDDRAFFDKHWPRGFEDFITKRSVKHSKD